MKAIAYRQHQMAVAVALSIAAAGLALPSIADAGTVSSGNAEVGKVQGRASASQVSGGSISTSGQNHATFGRGNGANHANPAQRVATRPVDGALQMSGRGNAPAGSIAKLGHPTRVAASR